MLGPEALRSADPPTVRGDFLDLRLLERVPSGHPGQQEVPEGSAAIGGDEHLPAQNLGRQATRESALVQRDAVGLLVGEGGSNPQFTIHGVSQAAAGWGTSQTGARSQTGLR